MRLNRLSATLSICAITERRKMSKGRRQKKLGHDACELTLFGVTHGCFLCGSHDVVGFHIWIPNEETAAAIGVAPGMQRTCLRPSCDKCIRKDAEFEDKIIAEYKNKDSRVEHIVEIGGRGMA